MAKVIRAAVLLGLYLNTFGREILSYNNGSTMRKEEGIPGKSVTGEWTWFDHNGKERKITYIADSNGFRAFGDLVPENWSSQDHKMPIIGSSVVPAVDEDDMDNEELEARDVPASKRRNEQKSITKSDEVSKVPEILIKDKPKEFERSSTTESRLGILKNDTSLEDSLIAGSSFTLLSKRLPTSFSSTMATEAAQIKPIPVTNGSPLTVVTGILTAPRAKKVLANDRRAKTFNRLPAADRKPPTPFKVEGMLNFDTFFRPSVSNSAPNNGAAQINFDDYYYYDDYYFDEASSVSSTTSSGIELSTTNASPSTTTTTRKPKPKLNRERVRRIRSEESDETSEESNSYDSDESK